MSVSILVVRALVEVLERSGGSRADLFARLALDSRRLDEPEARLDFDEVEQVLAAALALTGDEDFALHLAERMPDAALDLLAHLAAHAPTFREAVAGIAQFSGLAMDGMRFTTREDEHAFVIGCAFPRTTPLADRMFAEMATAGLTRLARTFIGQHVMPRRASFEHERPKSDREYKRIFGERLRFRQSETFIAFDRELADRRQMHHNLQLYSLLRAEAERRIDRIAIGVRTAARLHQYLLAIPASRIPDMGSAARNLGMSDRSLRRHLAAEGTSYRDAVRSALETRAGRILRDPARSIKETAAALGFGNDAAFVRAFKRWTGTTPAEYRRARYGG
jgi:AraC-like DNA-binding protein